MSLDEDNMMTKKLNNYIIDFIEKYKSEIYLFVIIVLSVLIRYKLFRFQSADMQAYLLQWMNEITLEGGFSSLKNDIGTYNVPYMAVLTLFSVITNSTALRVLLIKIFSAVFDYALAFFVYFILKNNGYKKDAVLGFAAVILNPVILLNSAYWGQCDIIYAAFVVFSLYFSLKEKWGLSFVMIGIGIAFKLQAVFFLPVLVLLWYKKRFNFLYFFIIPVIDFIMCLPAIIAGRNILEVMGIYIEQTTVFPEMLKNYPNIYFVYRCPFEDFYKVGLLFTIFVLGSGMYYFIQNHTFSQKTVFSFSIWCIWSCVMFLPAMHERYGMAMEILLLLFVIIYHEHYEVCVGVYLTILCLYSWYLFEIEIWDKKYTSLINIILYFYFSYKIFKKDHPNEKIKDACGG